MLHVVSIGNIVRIREIKWQIVTDKDLVLKYVANVGALQCNILVKCFIVVIKCTARTFDEWAKFLA